MSLPFVEFLEPSAADAPILSPSIRAAMRQWLTEQSAKEELAEVGLTPRRTVLLDGPPGCGKTTLAHHLAARLGLKLALVNMSGLCSKYVHETGENISKLFFLLKKEGGEPILFLDEFDSIATARSNFDTAVAKEKNNIVISLLQHIDSYDGIMFAATNKGDNIDPAIWRRFHMHLKIEEPDDECRAAILTRYFAPFSLNEKSLQDLTQWTKGATPALLRGLAEGIKRELVLAPKFNIAIDPTSVLNRILLTVQPHQSLLQPPLWSGSVHKDRIAALAPWPPIRGNK